MRGEYFRKKMSEITPDEVASFAERRWKMLTEGPGNICIPADPDVSPYAPFDRQEYAHAGLVGSLYEPPWTQILDAPARALIPPNPFWLSKIRGSTPEFPAFQIWDAAIGVPACSVRTALLKDIRDIAAARNCNTHWAGPVAQALHRTGPLGSGGKLVRPAGPYIYDCMRMEHTRAWQIMEAAHVLAHLRGDTKNLNRRYAITGELTQYHFQAAVAEIQVALCYDIPMDVTDKNAGKPGEPDSYYATEVKSSSHLRAPVIRLPWCNREAARPDATLAMVLTAIFIEPPPYGYMMRSGSWELYDRWTGMPTITIIAGWEGVDYLLHQALGVHKAAPVSYIIRANDLLPPDTYWYYLWLAIRAGNIDGKPLFQDPTDAVKRPGSRWQYFDDWVASAEYRQLLSQTPPLPCRGCLSINHESEGAPKRPLSPRPKETALARMPPEWRTWFTEREAIYTIAQKAVEAYENNVYGKAQMARSRRTRLAAHRRRMIELRKQKRLAAVLAKMHTEKGLTSDRDRTLYLTYVKNNCVVT